MPFILQRLINYSNYFPLLFAGMKLSLASETVYVFLGRTFLLCLCLLQFYQNSIRIGRPGKCINGIIEVMRLMGKVCTCALAFFMHHLSGRDHLLLKAGHLHNAIASVKFQYKLH